MEKKIVVIEPSSKIKDKVSLQKEWDEYEIDTNKKIAKGHIKVYKYDINGNLIEQLEQDNKVVIVGRSWAAQKLFNADYDSVNPVKHRFASWFGVGSGGADPSTPFTPIAPNDSDTDLFHPETFGTNPSIYADSGYKKNFTSLEFPDQTTIKLILTVDYNEVTPGTLINELGIYASNSSDPATANEFNLFSHVTFASIQKDNTFKLVVEWYIVF